MCIRDRAYGSANKVTDGVVEKADKAYGLETKLKKLMVQATNPLMVQATNPLMVQVQLAPRHTVQLQQAQQQLRVRLTVQGIQAPQQC